MKLILGPGLYYINGYLDLEGSSVTNQGGPVMFYLTGDAANPPRVFIANNASPVDLTTAKTADGSCFVAKQKDLTLTQLSCDYSGILFFEDPSITTPGKFYVAGGVTGNWDGTVYLPHAELEFDNGTHPTVKGTIIADTMVFAGGNQTTIGGDAAVRVSSYKGFVVQ
jgi:hypothetical protein